MKKIVCALKGWHCGVWIYLFFFGWRGGGGLDVCGAPYLCQPLRYVDGRLGVQCRQNGPDSRPAASQRHQYHTLSKNEGKSSQSCRVQTGRGRRHNSALMFDRLPQQWWSVVTASVVRPLRHVQTKRLINGRGGPREEWGRSLTR